MFRARTFDPIIEVRDGGSRSPWPRVLRVGDEVDVYLEEFPIENLNRVRVRVAALEGDFVRAVVSRPTRHCIKRRLDARDDVEFDARAVWAFA